MGAPAVFSTLRESLHGEESLSPWKLAGKAEDTPPNGAFKRNLGFIKGEKI